MRKAGSARKRPAAGIRWDEQNLEENEVIKASISKTKIDEPKTPYHGPLGEQHMEDADDGLQPLELDSHHQQLPYSLGGNPAAVGESESASSRAITCASSAAVAEAAAGPQPPQAGAGGAAVATGAEGEDGRDASCEAAGPSGPAEHKHGHGHGHGHHAHFESSSMQSTDPPATEPLESRSGFSSDSERRASLTGGSDGDQNCDEARRKFEQLCALFYTGQRPRQRRKAHYNMRAALRRARLLLHEDGEGDSVAGEGDSDEAKQEEGGVGSDCTATSEGTSDVMMEDVGKQLFTYDGQVMGLQYLCMLYAYNCMPKTFVTSPHIYSLVQSIYE
ncbi:hypothetical protein VOLCADRAFT_104928 [Volvox carteri f. nagariensis]|uniref:Uncharacterized protein n=1 Tax=Volvox carteri f. nagariensis TaxID=3068 RepID=D8TX55_VOLCA|nr:uncharacterized protein VOLCADRAFT_104928 [Volvox carteri f. nagariensis]EFJ47952.1 hypothetical protein VOLCADRAFT_104928 [Volvox carteri f. nagariensis]|eukprot:XP_002951058.1 hypothetical protein VOLCADRAFT_104928 [Volvox carteri f. nagariensis]